MAPTHTCPCQHCGQPLAFPPEMLGQEAGCPHCGAATLLHELAADTPTVEAAVERSWFYNLAGETHGPVAESALSAMMAESQLPAETWVWAEGEADWRPANELVCFQTAPPPIPSKLPPKISRQASGSSGGLGQIGARSNNSGASSFRPIGSSSATGAAPVSSSAPVSNFKPVGGGGGSFASVSGLRWLKLAGSALVVLLVVGGIVVKVVWKSGLLAKAPALGKIFGGGDSVQTEIKNYLTFRDQQINAINQSLSAMPGGIFAPPAATASALDRSVIPALETSLRAYQGYRMKDAGLLEVKQVEIGVMQQRIQAYRSLSEACKQQDRPQIQTAQRQLSQTQQQEREAQNKLREIGSKAGMNITFRPF